MPSGKKMTKRHHKARAQRAAMVPRPLIQAVTYVNFQYQEFATWTESASGVGTFYSFRLNDLYDPNAAVGGFQPVAFDQVCTLYSRFRVVDVAADVEIMNTTTTPMTVVTFPSSASTLPPSCQAWPLQPYAQSALLGSVNGGKSVWRNKRRYKIWDILGISKSQYMNEFDFTCTGSSGPLRAAYLHVCIYTRSGTIGVAGGNVRLSFRTECSQPVLNDPS